MSYDITLNVKAEGIDRYFEIAEPEHPNPTYNLGDMFRACMDWYYNQGEYYRCSDIIENIDRGINELTYNRKEYEKYNPSNGWGNINDAMDVLQSIRECIYKQGIPFEYIYLRW